MLRPMRSHLPPFAPRKIKPSDRAKLPLSQLAPNNAYGFAPGSASRGNNTIACA
jgi:hypothetical protein